MNRRTKNPSRSPEKRTKKPEISASPAREAALDVLGSVGSGKFAETGLSESLQARSLSPEDRGLATELTYGVLRWRSRLDAIIDQCLTKPGRKLDPTAREILRIALYQLIMLDRIPRRAAVHQAVIQARNRLNDRAAGFVNALLRTALRNLGTLDRDPSDDCSSLAAYYSYPAWLVKSRLEKYGVETTRSILMVGNSRSQLILRTNSLKTTPNRLLDLLSGEGFPVVPTVPEPDALWVQSTGCAVADLPGFDRGLFAVQDRASQMIAPLLKPQPGERILDACAAPGGKTAHLAALTMNGVRITAMDRSAQRLEDTRRNLDRLGVACAELIRGDAADESSMRNLGKFHKILLDAPCSNLGVLRHNPEVKYRSTPQHLGKLGDIQLGMLKTVSSALPARGSIVYSVCTTTEEETTEVVKRFLEECPEFSIDPILPEEVQVAGIVSSGFMTTLPSPEDLPLDGFFAARLKKS
ncbi:MAG: 16S rRNA (cytosine(967)-C(5))-methyltransferase RsmB [Pseudomonadota bacterium]